MRSRAPLVLAGVVGIILGVGPVPANAQSEAVVREARSSRRLDGSRLAQGTVTLKSTTTGKSIQTTVDAAGRFTFSNVRPRRVYPHGFGKRFCKSRRPPCFGTA